MPRLLRVAPSMHATIKPAVALVSFGIAWALVGLLRAVPFHARLKRLYLPRELSEAAGLDLGTLFALRASPALAEVVRQVAAHAVKPGKQTAQPKVKRGRQNRA